MKEHKHGFTLIEMIGVLAIMSILASIIVPNVVKQMQVARQDTEGEVLDRLADSLKNYVLEYRIIPKSGYGAGDWSTSIATQADLAITDIYQNDLDCDRRYWFDPSTDLNGLSNNSAAYNQNTVAVTNLSGYSGTTTASPPVNPRAMIISDITPGCTNNIGPASVAHTTANFANTWDQTSPPLTEGNTLKIKRINLSRLFETVTLQSIPQTIFARKTYSSPASSDGPIVTWPVLTTEKNSHIFSVLFSTGGFEPINPAGIATVDIGYTSGGDEFVSGAIVTTGTPFTQTAITPAHTSTSDINVSLELTITNSDPGTATSGYIDVAVEYQGEPQYKLEGQTGNPATITIGTPGTPEIVSFNVLNGTEIKFYDQSGTSGGAAGDQLLSTVIKESDSFIYSPGPPTIWGR